MKPTQVTQPCATTLFRKPTIFNFLYQDMHIALKESESCDGTFFCTVWNSYKGSVKFEDSKEAATYIRNNMAIPHHFDELLNTISTAMSNIKSYASYCNSQEAVKRNINMFNSLSYLLCDLKDNHD